MRVPPNPRKPVITLPLAPAAQYTDEQMRLAFAVLRVMAVEVGNTQLVLLEPPGKGVGD